MKKIINLLIKIHQRIIWKTFYFNQRFLKMHILPIHFYSPIPDTRNIPPDEFSKEFSCPGIKWQDENQLNLLQNVYPKYKEEFTPYPNGGLSLVDAFMLYAFARENKPQKIIEIGGGDSTQILLKALQKNREEGHAFTFHSIDPFPRKQMLDAKDQDLTIIPKMVQDVPVEFFKDCDMLFIDSTHVSKFGSDVNYEILEIVPSLKSGALIHWHDILFPSEYWSQWVTKSALFWNESYLLQSFMSFNSDFQIQWASRYMQLRNTPQIKEVLPYFKDSHNVTSFWIKRL